ncbi:hypothetical protein FQA39_LY09383 [Lamprigera yunnana]|nr:hypothetical protein FQA39_LY09383 [Lamprigera yunnana]
MKNTVEEDIENELLEIIQSPAVNEDHYMVKYEKRLFQSCMNEAELEEDGLPILQSMIRELNEWPVVVGHKWRERQFDWPDVLIKLRKSGYFDSMLLNINIDMNENNTKQVIITPARIMNIATGHKDAYLKYMSDVAILLKAEPNRASIEMEKVLDFTEKLNEISQNHWMVNNDSTATVREFEQEYDDIDWFRLISVFVNPHTLTIHDEMSFPSSDFMDAFTTLMSKTPKRILANYIIWRVIDELIMFMPKAFRDLKTNYTCATEESVNVKERSKLCQSILADLFVVKPSEVLYTRKHLTLEKQEQVNDLFENIKEEIIELVENMPWFASTDKEKILENLNDTAAVIGTDWEYADDTIFEKYEISGGKRSYGGSFLKMYLNRKKQTKNSLKWSKDMYDIFINNDMAGVTPLYYNYKNKLELPVGMLEKQFHKPGGPMYLTYAAFGKAIGQELLSPFVMESNFRKWPKTSIRRFYDQLQCFFKNVNEKGINEPDLQTGIFSNLVGLKAAYKAYQKYVEENEEEIAPLGIDYTPNQLFWIASVSNECYETDPDDFNRWVQLFHQKNIPFNNMEEFSNDFSCSSESKMNSAERCSIVE